MQATSTTIYTVTVTDTNGCSSSDEVKITVYSLPIANAGSDISICIGSATQLNASGGGVFYSWNPSRGLSNSNIQNPIANPTSTTKYVVTVGNLNGCLSTDTIIITVNKLPKVNAGIDASICLGAAQR